MAAEEREVVRLKSTFYRDGFYKILIALSTVLTAIVFLIGISIFIYMDKPKPVYFHTDNEWRILPPVPLDKPYLKVPDLVQWVSTALPSVFTYDFINYTKQLQNASQYFTPNGWQKFLEQINHYANYNEVLTSKMFISANPAGAPIILNQGLLEGRYAWWILMPINVNYIIPEKRNNTVPLEIRALVVRVPTLNNIDGVGIENIIISEGTADQIIPVKNG